MGTRGGLNRNRAFIDLIGIIGTELGLEVCRELGGQDIYVPQELTLEKRARAQGMTLDRTNGVAWRAIAEKWNVSERSARKSVKLWADRMDKLNEKSPL